MNYPDSYFWGAETQRLEADLATQKYWEEQEKKKREERKKRLAEKERNNERI